MDRRSLPTSDISQKARLRLMNVLIRLDSLSHPRTGLGYYTENLVRAIRSGFSDVTITGYYRGRIIMPEDLVSILDEHVNAQTSSNEGGWNVQSLVDHARSLVRAIPGAYPARHVLTDWLGPIKASAVDASIYHEPTSVPMSFDGPTVLTVHDMSHVRFPQYHPRYRVSFLNRYLSKAIPLARHIITDSEFTRRELCDLFPAASDKITAIHLGVDDDFRPRSSTETQPVLEKWSLTHGEYIVSVATLEPRKNLVGLVKAYKDLPARIRDNLPLVLVGGRGWKNRELDRLLSGLDMRSGCIILTGRTSKTELTSLISGARLFTYPSFYEGFGLPVAEARASGVPVLTSNRGATREIAGDQAILVDPLDFSDDLKQVLDQKMHRIEPYRFSWNDTARKTVDIYKTVL